MWVREHIHSSFIRRHRVDLMISSFVIIMAIMIKSVAFLWFNTKIGDSFYGTQTSSAADFFRIILLSPFPVRWQGYDDAWYHYSAYVEAFVNGWNPYSSSGIPNDAISGQYTYGPLYIIFISLGTIMFGLSPYDSILLSNVIFDSVNCALLYIIMRNYYRELTSFGISVLYMISPVMLYYIDFKLMNLPQITFFSLLFVLAFLHDHHQLAVISLAFGFMTKFVPIFFVLPLGLYYWRRFGPKYTAKLLLIFFAYSIAIILPFLVDDPTGVMTQLFYVSTSHPSDSFSITTGISNLLLPNLPLVFGTIITFAMFWYGKEQLIEDKILVLRVFIFYILGAHGSFYPLYSRGFKYYHGYLMVFYILLYFVVHQPSTRKIWVATALVYLTNMLIINLHIDITSFHHRRVFWIYLPGILILWIFYDLRKIRNATMLDDESENKT